MSQPSKDWNHEFILWSTDVTCLIDAVSIKSHRSGYKKD